MTTLEKFKAYLEEMNRYNAVVVLLEWDMMTKAPKQGKEGIADNIAYFSTEYFKMSTADELYEMLQELNRPDVFETLNEVDAFTVKKMLKDMEEDRRVSPELFREYVTARTAAENVWVEAKNASDFGMFAPALEKLIALTRRVTELKYPGVPVYEALLNQYEEGMSSADIDRVFEELKTGLIPLVKEILAAPQPDDTKFKRTVPKHHQDALCEFLLRYQGFDFERGALGETEHPFTTGVNMKDARIANHFHEEDAISAIFSAIHEGGHAIFGQQVEEKWIGTPGQDCSNMGLHESQSRFYENILGRNIHFWKPIWSKAQELMPEYGDITVEEFYLEINHVRASFIRTEADEVTYAFHVILRYEIEKAIFEDNLPVAELPALWNKKMQEYLGIVPSCDREGVLQDSHWSGGGFGYFPDYLLGSIYDGMFLEAMEEDLGSVNLLLEEGRIAEITAWLGEKIHRYGNTRTPAEVLEQVCDKQVTAAPLLRFFEKKYRDVYNLR